MVVNDLDKFKDIGVTINSLFSKKYGKTIDYTFSGDKHHLEAFEQFGVESTLVGSLCGTDEYAKSLREATKAELESQYATAKIGAKAAEEALKDKTYNAWWDGSQITIAKNEQMNILLFDLGLHILKVDLVFLPVILQRIFQHPGSVIDDGIEEYVVYRCLNDDILIRSCQLSDR